MGSRFSIFIEQLKQDFSQIFLSVAIIIVGMIFGFISILGYHRKGEKPDLIYLAFSIIMIGIWRITDIRFSPWLLDDSSLVSSYITLGMLALVCGFATALKKSIPGKCFMGRYGGDEFIVIVRKTNTGSMEEILERLAASVKEMNQSGDNPDISYSAGYTISNGKEVMQELFEKADEKMYIEKKRYHASEKNEFL